MPGFQSFFKDFSSFLVAKLATSSIRVNNHTLSLYMLPSFLLRNVYLFEVRYFLLMIKHLFTLLC